MLIKRGKAEGWLHLDVDGVKTWATASGIGFTNASPSAVPGRGVGLLADRDLNIREHGKPWEILSISEDLVLSVDAVKKHALFDQDFRELLESLGDFGRRNLLGNEVCLLCQSCRAPYEVSAGELTSTQTPRGAILSFLIFQASISCPHLSDRVGVHCAFTEYVKSLPCELLPIFWTPEELQLLVGTTLAPAVSSKLKSLHREYDLLCESAANTRWFQIVEPLLEFDDWLQVDAMFRSRALDFYGSCMIPGMDLASHAAGERTNAFYDRAEGQYFLWLLEGKDLRKGDEITITYGDEKGACEMLFSYGFLEEEMDTAETLFLSLAIPEDDVSRVAKMKVAQCAPGFKIIDASQGKASNDDESNPETTGADQPENTPGGDVDWKGDFVWLMCTSEDDGLRFELARTTDGQEELQATFNGHELTHGAADLRRLLAQSSMWPVFRLRAIVILQQRVFDQLQTLYGSQDEIEAVPYGDDTAVREAPFQQAMKLRRLEFELLERAYEDFENQKVELASSPIVQEYLAEMSGGQAEEDFS